MLICQWSYSCDTLFRNSFTNNRLIDCQSINLQIAWSVKYTDKVKNTHMVVASYALFSLANSPELGKTSLIKSLNSQEMAQPFTCIGIYKYRAPDTHCLLAPIIVEVFLEGLH